MTGHEDSDRDDGRPNCAGEDCGLEAAFWWYDGAGLWWPVCDRHAQHLHPSLEVHAWLESGYMRPVERGQPAGEPAEPSVSRGRAFRDAIDELLGWGE